MKQVMIPIVLLIIGIALTGCGVTAKEIQAKSFGERTDIFYEVREEGVPHKGFVDVVIKASIKTHHEGYYVLESKKSLHGKAGYPFVLNIDGQAVTWKVDGHEDIKPKYDGKEKAVPDPEAGEGMKYILERKIRMAAGPHRIFFALPEDDYALEAIIVFKEDGSNTLEFKPVYKSERKYYSIRKSERMKRNETFLKGIKGLEIFLNGNPILF